ALERFEETEYAPGAARRQRHHPLTHNSRRTYHRRRTECRSGRPPQRDFDAVARAPATTPRRWQRTDFHVLAADIRRPLRDLICGDLFRTVHPEIHLKVILWGPPCRRTVDQRREELSGRGHFREERPQLGARCGSRVAEIRRVGRDRVP